MCFLSFGFARITEEAITTGIILMGFMLCFMAVMLYSTLSPVNERFEIGTRTAQHQYGPFRIEVESTIKYVDDFAEIEENENPGIKTRTINCRAITKEGDVIASKHDTQVVGSRPLSIFMFFSLGGGDNPDIQSTNRRIMTIASEVKDEAIEHIANNGNDPEIKAALESQLGEEWDENDKNENERGNGKSNVIAIR